MATSKKTHNNILSNDAMGLHVGDDISLNNVWKNATDVPAEIVGFFPDGRPVVSVDAESGYGSDIWDNYKDGVNTEVEEYEDLAHDVEDGERKLWALSANPDDKQFTRAEIFGLGLGDEIELGRTKNGSLIITDKKWDTTGRYPPVKAKVIGFKKTRQGKITAPLLGIDRKISKIKSTSAKWNYNKEDHIARRYQDKWGENSGVDVHSDHGFCYITSKTVFNKIHINKEKTQGVRKMNSNTQRPAFLDMVKTDAKDAGYRIAATQISKGGQAAILSIFSKYGGSSDGIKALSEMLDTEYGMAIISMGLGLGGNYLPVEFMKDPRVQRVCEELRVNAMAGAGNKIVGEIMELVMPVLMSALVNLPEEQAGTNARIATTSSSHDEDEHVEETFQRKHA